MSSRRIRVAIITVGLFLAAVGTVSIRAQETNRAEQLIDLPTTLRLAGAQNVDVQIAQERLHEAEAKKQSALEEFFPWIAPGISYHRRDGVAQAVPSGIISDAHFESYSPGVSLAGQIALGDAIYHSLAAKQLAKASTFALESQRQEAVFSAAEAYFDLAKTKALVEVVEEAVRVSEDYQQQLHAGVAAGIAFRGDELRVQTQTEQYRISEEQVVERARVAGVSLARLLHLDPRIALLPRDRGTQPIVLFPTNSTMDPLVALALRARPELKENRAITAAARNTKNGAVFGPLIPFLGVQAFGGGLGGGPDGGPGNFGPEGDYAVTAGWRIGPGGLFDSGKVNATKARLAEAQLTQTKLNDSIIAEVVSSLTRVNSTAAQIQLAQKNLNTANETFRLTRERKNLGVGAVLEDIQAQQALTQARSAYVTAVAEHNKAQYALNKAVGSFEKSPDSATLR